MDVFGFPERERGSAMCSESIIQLHNISKRYEIYRYPWHRLIQTLCMGHVTMYKEFLALRNVSLEIKRGECVGIIGRNGAGKSTLLQIIANTLFPTSGEMKVSGKIAALLELGSGFNPEFSGEENIMMYGAILGLSEDRIREKYQDIVDFADIGDAISQPVKTYSSGMAMRLAFAVAAHIDADVLIVDEALAVGDIVFVQKCFSFLREFMKNHTVILVSHDIATVRDLCDRVIWLVDGVVKADGAPAKVTDDYLRYCYESKQDCSDQSGTPQTGTNPEVTTEKHRDVRLQKWKENPALTPQYQFFEFDENAPSFGHGGARIRDIGFFDEKGTQLRSLGGGEMVTLKISIEAIEKLASPIVGFAIRNGRGENLFGDNTFESYIGKTFSAEAGEIFETVFRFEMPRIPPGEYALHAAIADGTQDQHVQQQWFHNAMTIVSTYHGKTGVLVGIPMLQIEMKKTKGVQTENE